MGRTAYGVKGINLGKGDYVIGMVVVKRDSSLLVVSENGYGNNNNGPTGVSCEGPPLRDASARTNRTRWRRASMS